MTQDFDPSKEIEEGLARADAMLRRQRLFLFFAILAGVVLLGLAFLGGRWTAPYLFPTITATATLTAVPTSTDTPVNTPTADPLLKTAVVIARQTATIQALQTARAPKTPTSQYYGRLVSETTFTVSANRSWQDTGVNVEKGYWFVVQYISGKWTADQLKFPYVDASGHRDLGSPDNYCLGCKAPMSYGTLGELVYTLGSQISYIGKSRAVRAPQTGNLYLMMNDAFDALTDNNGQLTVKIFVYQSK